MLKPIRRFLRRPANEFVIALCIALTIALIAVSLSPQSPFNHAPYINAKQDADKGVSSQQNTDRVGKTVDAIRNGGDGAQDASEYWSIFGHRVKITDTLLVVFTFTLWLATRDLVATSKDTAQRQLRAYVSGGGWRARNEREGAIGVWHHPLAHVIETETVPVRWRIIEPLDAFDIHINNHGQTPARLHHIRFGFFDAAAPVPDIPPYGELIVQVDAIGSPRNQSKFVRRVEYPAMRWPRTAICGRFYWTDVLDREWSSGFVYEIASGNAAQNDSISIEAPRVYGMDIREPDPE